MEKNLEIKKEGDNYRASIFLNRKRQGRSWQQVGKALYWNMLTKDKEILALLFLDLQMEGFPIIEACKIMMKKMDDKDWTGL